MLPDMLFEDHSVYGSAPFRAFTSKVNEGFPMRIHRPYECYVVISGKVTATINNTTYELLPGEAVLVFPYQRHKYDVEPGTEIWVCTFTPDIVGSFNKEKASLPLSNKFKFSAPQKRQFNSLVEKKALCYYICSVFNENATYSDSITETNELLMKILRYISSNYMNQCTLNDVCSYVGYDYAYISRFFKKMVGQTFKSYINDLRIGEARRLLRETDMNIETISEKCGFGTVRNFNLAFLTLTSKTPSEYRKI